jgi:hypothetical protein
MIDNLPSDWLTMALREGTFLHDRQISADDGEWRVRLVKHNGSIYYIEMHNGKFTHSAVITEVEHE